MQYTAIDITFTCANFTHLGRYQWWEGSVHLALYYNVNKYCEVTFSCTYHHTGDEPCLIVPNYYLQFQLSLELHFCFQLLNESFSNDFFHLFSQIRNKALWTGFTWASLFISTMWRTKFLKVILWPENCTENLENILEIHILVDSVCRLYLILNSFF